MLVLVLVLGLVRVLVLVLELELVHLLWEPASAPMLMQALAALALLRQLGLAVGSGRNCRIGCCSSCSRCQCHSSRL